VEVGEVEIHPARLDLGQVEDVVDQGEQVLAGGEDVLEVFGLLTCLLVRPTVPAPGLRRVLS
jgi:hypothetical protein